MKSSIFRGIYFVASLLRLGHELQRKPRAEAELALTMPRRRLHSLRSSNSTLPRRARLAPRICALKMIIFCGEGIYFVASLLRNNKSSLRETVARICCRGLFEIRGGFAALHGRFFRFGHFGIWQAFHD